MKSTQLSALSLALAACLSSGIAYADDSQDQSKKLNYPHTPIHQENLDPFLYGEFGMSSNTAGTKNAVHSSNPHAPDDGIDHYAQGTQVDKYRWLEDYDNIDASIAKETTEDRDRNFIGTLKEDDKPLAQETTKHLQTVPPKTSSKVNDWVEAQNAVTADYIYQLPIYEQLKKNTESLRNVEAPINRIYRKDLGEIYIYRHADGFRRIDLIAPDGKRTEIVNEANVSADGKKAPDGKAVIREVKVSKDGTYISFFVRQGSSDSDPWFLHIVNTKTGKLATPIISRINRTNPAMIWLDDDTIYYTAIDLYRAYVFYRDIGNENFNDPIAVPLSHVDGASINSIDFEGEDNRYIIMETWSGADSVYIKDRKTNQTYRLHDKKFFDKVFRYDSSFNNNILAKLVHFDPETRDVWIISGENKRKGEIIKTNLDNLNKREVVITTPDEYDLMREAYYHEEGDGYFLVSYLQHGVNRLLLINVKTAEARDLTPEQGAGYISNLSGNVVGKDDKEGEDDEAKKHDPEASENYVKFRFSNPTFPSTDYKYSISKNEFLDIRRYDLTPFDDTQFETKLVFYPANDGTKIPMNISYKKGIKLDGKNPTLLYGYGGYGVIYDQAFGFPANPMWLENGGVWAHAFIRGGGEYGEAWQKAAQYDKRLVGYDDFASAADYLNSAGYADPDHLGIIGGSNGGLLVGAAMVRHPEKYRVALPQVGVLDQFRHEKAGITQYWTKEYGTPEEGRRIHDILMSYSPYQNLNPGTCYPSTLIQTSKRDDRVVPSHSYRFAAKLQEVQSCDRPALLNAAEDQGHSPNTYAERLEDQLMAITFAFHEMGVTSVPNLEARPSTDEFKTAKWRAEDAQKKQEYLKNRQEIK